MIGVAKSAVIDILAEFGMLEREFELDADPLTVHIPPYEWGGNVVLGLHEVIDYCMRDTDDWEISIWRDLDGSVVVTIVNGDEEL